MLFHNQFWSSQSEFNEWHEGQLVPVPQKRDTSDPNKCIGITLMNTGKTFYSSIMCGRLFKITIKHGVKCHFGSTPGVGYQYYTFTIKTLLHIRHNHKLPTRVAFLDPFKAFDTSYHELIISIMEKYSAPPRLCSEIKRMYNKRIVKIIIGKIETTIDFKLGVKQGDSMALVVFLFLMMYFNGTLEDN